MHTQGLVSGCRQDLEQAVAILVTCPRPLALAAALEGGEAHDRVRALRHRLRAAGCG
jgi:hypothetical protein